MNSESFSAPRGAVCEPRAAALIIFFCVSPLSERLLDCNVQSQTPAEKINFHLMEFTPLSSHEPDSIVIPAFPTADFFPTRVCVSRLHIGKPMEHA
jgi:hypothetical protein